MPIGSAERDGTLAVALRRLEAGGDRGWKGTVHMQQRKKRDMKKAAGSITRVALVALLALAPGAETSAQTCEGDCNGDGSVAVAELILGIRIALGDLPLDDCGAMDRDGSSVVAVDELLAAVTAALQGCGGQVDEAILAASTRVATEPLLRFFDFQARIGTPGGVAGRSTIPGCQQFDCVASGRVTGSEEDCCFGTRFTQVFDNCTFDDGLGGFVSLSGAFVLDSDNVDVCTGAIPLGASFTASVSGLTHDVSFPDGSFSRTFQELLETFEVATGGCTVRQPEQFGFGIRGDGRRFIDGVLQQFQSDGFGNVLVDTETDVRALAIEVGSTGEPDDCTLTAALRGSVSSADFRVGTQFGSDLGELRIVQPPQAAALLLGLNGTVGTDCLGPVALSTIEPLRVVPGDTCFTAGRLDVQFKETASVTYADSGLDLDFGADGSVERHFATCSDVPATNKCVSSVAGLCGACSAVDQCQGGLSCFPCSRNCTGNTRRCSFGDAFATCADGVF
jgi:hypothetical protein